MTQNSTRTNLPDSIADWTPFRELLGHFTEVQIGFSRQEEDGPEGEQYKAWEDSATAAWDALTYVVDAWTANHRAQAITAAKQAKP